MSEFVVIQVGQCGNQIGSSLLPEILQEYDVKTSQEPPSKSKRDKLDLQEFMSSFFNYNKRCGSFNSLGDLLGSNAKARILCIDMEESVVARFKQGKYRGLYDKKSLITNSPGSGNNWAEGFCSHGPEYKKKILAALRYNVEQCENLHGFLLLFSMGGGTGSGLGTFILRLLADNYPNIARFVVCVYPIGTEDVITAPYNMAFATRELLNNATCVFPVENRCLMEITKRQIRNGSVYPFQPFEDMNKIIVDALLHLTSGARFGGKMNIDMNDINTNMVPFPRLNFLASGFSPVMLKFTNTDNFLKNQLVVMATSRTNQLVKVDPFDCRYTCMSVMLQGRGNYSISEMRSYIDKLQTKVRFAAWSKKAVKVGLCSVPPKDVDFSMFALSNTTAMSGLFHEILAQFKKLYQRKAHVHHYTAVSEFDMDNFKECQNNLNDIVQMYRDIEKIKPCVNMKI